MPHTLLSATYFTFLLSFKIRGTEWWWTISVGDDSPLTAGRDGLFYFGGVFYSHLRTATIPLSKCSTIPCCILRSSTALAVVPYSTLYTCSEFREKLVKAEDNRLPFSRHSYSDFDFFRLAPLSTYLLLRALPSSKRHSLQFHFPAASNEPYYWVVLSF